MNRGPGNQRTKDTKARKAEFQISRVLRSSRGSSIGGLRSAWFQKVWEGACAHARNPNVQCRIWSAKASGAPSACDMRLNLAVG